MFRFHGLAGLVVRRDHFTTIWMLVLAVALATLIVQMNAFAAKSHAQNVVSFYSYDDQTNHHSADSSVLVTEE